MRRIMVVGLAAAVCLFGAGCNKKTTKVAPAPVAPAAQPAPAPQAEPQPLPDSAAFKALQMDSLMQQTFKTVYFDFDKCDLRHETEERLQIIGRFLSEHASMRVLAAGHADELGSAEYNMGLGERRAKAVKDYLVAYGINTNRLETTSYGKERPAVKNCSDPECHAQNRRVEWSVIAK